jgi:hypothetical protein
MKAPANVSELMNLLNSMNHRERKCYPIRPELKKQFPEADTIEIYTTILWDLPEQPKNVNVKLCQMDGKLITDKSGKAIINKSKYFRLFSSDFASSLLSLIDGNTGTLRIE